MKSKKTIGMLALVALFVGGSIAAVTQTSMDEMMQMMRKKMMNRPAAMMSADKAVQDRESSSHESRDIQLLS